MAKRGGEDKSGREGVTLYIPVRINWGGQLNFSSEATIGAWCSQTASQVYVVRNLRGIKNEVTLPPTQIL